MKNKFTIALVAAASFLGASPSVVAAPKKADANVGTLVAALQKVSPDPLGGRLGLAVAAARTSGLAVSASVGSRTVQTSGASADLRAYLAWKKSQKS